MGSAERALSSLAGMLCEAAEESSALESEAEQLRREVQLREAELAEARAHLSERSDKVDELERVATRLAERVVEREAELRSARGELAEARRRADDAAASVAEVAREIAQLHAGARSQATRIRLEALREAAAVSGRARRLEARPDAPSLAEAVRDAVNRLGASGGSVHGGGPKESPGAAPEGETGTDDGAAELVLEESEAEEAVEVGEVRVTQVSGTEPGNPGVRDSGAQTGRGVATAEHRRVFEGTVEVEIGPLSDFSQLVAFEDAASGIAATRDVSVRRFSQGRATIRLRLSEPVALVEELERRTPFSFRVREHAPDRLGLDVGE